MRTITISLLHLIIFVLFAADVLDFTDRTGCVPENCITQPEQLFKAFLTLAHFNFAC